MTSETVGIVLGSILLTIAASVIVYIIRKGEFNDPLTTLSRPISSYDILGSELGKLCTLLATMASVGIRDWSFYLVS